MPLSFSDRVDVLNFTQHSESLLDDLFYNDVEIAEFRHEAFLVECGLVEEEDEEEGEWAECHYHDTPTKVGVVADICPLKTNLDDKTSISVETSKPKLTSSIKSKTTCPSQSQHPPTALQDLKAEFSRTEAKMKDHLDKREKHHQEERPTLKNTVVAAAVVTDTADQDYPLPVPPNSKASKDQGIQSNNGESTPLKSRRGTFGNMRSPGRKVKSVSNPEIVVTRCVNGTSIASKYPTGHQTPSSPTDSSSSSNKCSSFQELMQRRLRRFPTPPTNTMTPVTVRPTPGRLPNNNNNKNNNDDGSMAIPMSPPLVKADRVATTTGVTTIPMSPPLSKADEVTTTVSMTGEENEPQQSLSITTSSSIESPLPSALSNLPPAPLSSPPAPDVPPPAAPLSSPPMDEPVGTSPGNSKRASRLAMTCSPKISIRRHHAPQPQPAVDKKEGIIKSQENVAVIDSTELSPAPLKKNNVATEILSPKKQSKSRPNEKKKEDGKVDRFNLGISHNDDDGDVIERFLGKIGDKAAKCRKLSKGSDSSNPKDAGVGSQENVAVISPAPLKKNSVSTPRTQTLSLKKQSKSRPSEEKKEDGKDDPSSLRISDDDEALEEFLDKIRGKPSTSSPRRRKHQLLTASSPRISRRVSESNWASWTSFYTSSFESPSSKGSPRRRSMGDDDDTSSSEEEETPPNSSATSFLLKQSIKRTNAIKSPEAPKSAFTVTSSSRSPRRARSQPITAATATTMIAPISQRPGGGDATTTTTKKKKEQKSKKLTNGSTSSSSSSREARPVTSKDDREITTSTASTTATPKKTPSKRKQKSSSASSLPSVPHLTVSSSGGI